ncbi:hypothetical protein ACTQ4K_19350 [Clostridium sporogenes]|uniref:hypothetical protein n=1 Tax=Clostridium sporogenes TaxID=1509 RepID=UPI003F92EB43
MLIGPTGPKGVTGPNQLGTIYVYRDLITSLVVATNQAISYNKVGPINPSTLYSFTPPSINIIINQTGLYRIFYTQAVDKHILSTAFQVYTKRIFIIYVEYI